MRKIGIWGVHGYTVYPIFETMPRPSRMGLPRSGWSLVDKQPRFFSGTGGSNPQNVIYSSILVKWENHPRDGYGSIPINTIFRGMNIHLLAILMFTRGTRF